MILLDTHVLMWLRTGDPCLGPVAHREIDRALRANQLALSAISFWEIQMLCKQHRIEVDYAIDEWRRVLLSEGLIEIPLDGEIATRAVSLTDLHSDPADRFIVATALKGHRLVTADRRILDWPGTVSRLDASR